MADLSSSIPLQLAETIQTAHINRHPSAAHDVNPSTAASRREPVVIDEKTAPVARPSGKAVGHEDHEEVDEIPYSVLRPKRRRPTMPPLPDLRFEQSYLHSIAKADTWQKVAWITARDQIVMPFVQGIVYNLVLCGWQFWNRNARLSGSSVGARVRRWWYGVNNWPIPPEKLKVQ